MIIPPTPYRSPVLASDDHPSDGFAAKVIMSVLRLVMSRDWLQWFRRLTDAINATSMVVGSVNLDEQAASIASTSIPVSDIEGTAMYRISWYLRVTRAASVSSSVTVTVGWTQNTISLSYPGSAVTGNAVTTIQSGTVMVRVDADSEFTYETTYASNGATSMQYHLDVVVEEVG